MRRNCSIQIKRFGQEIGLRRDQAQIPWLRPEIRYPAAHREVVGRILSGKRFAKLASKVRLTPACC
jgi:hypothetical protein